MRLTLPIAIPALLAASPVFGQILELPLTGGFEDPEMRVLRRIASEFPNPGKVRVKNITRLPNDRRGEISYCGQVNGTDGTGAYIGFQVFTYGKDPSGESVRILGSETLNGYRVGRKMIAMLKRVGCL